MNIIYPNLEKAIRDCGLLRPALARILGISIRAFYDKLTGRTAFTLDEALLLAKRFPDVPFLELFQRQH